MHNHSPSASLRAVAVLATGFALVMVCSLERYGAASTGPTAPDVKARNCHAATQCLSVTNSSTGNAIKATSAAGVGVVGTTNNKSTQDGYGTNGITGVDAAADGGQQNIGVQGVSATSNGVEGVTDNPSTTSPFGRAAVFGIDGSSDGGRRNWGTAGFSSTGSGILGISFAVPQTHGAPFASALLAVCENGGPSIEAANGPLPTANLFLLADCAGNLTLEGTVTTGTPPLIVTKRTSGPAVGAYAPREAEPTIEDVGEAQLVAGRANVPLGRDFAPTIAQNARYLVFITPEGDNRGLYVAKKTNDGFEVRESQGGRSSISFSYRIVAHPLGTLQARLPLLHTTLSGNGERVHQQPERALDVARQIGALSPSRR